MLIFFIKPKNMNIEVDVNKDYLFVIEANGRKNQVLAGKQYPASSTIAKEDVIVDYPVDENGKKGKPEIRKIRFCSGERSIFVDEQSENAVGTPITFNNGILRVSGREINKVKFLLCSNYNKDLPKENRQHGRYQYRLFNPNADANAAVIGQKKNINLKARILNMPFEDLKHLALATSKSEQMIAQIYRSQEAEIRHYMMQQVDSNSEVFSLDLDDQVLCNRVIITRAINEGLLTYNSKTRKISNASNNTTIIQSALGTNAIQEFSSLATENTEYGSLIADYKKKMNITKLFSDEFHDRVSEVKNELEGGNVFEKVIRAGVKTDAVIKNGNFYTYANIKHNGIKKFVEYLQDNPSTYMNLCLELDK